MKRGRERRIGSLIVFAPIAARREPDLRRYLESLASPGPSPLAKLDRTHVGRWVIVPDFVNDPSQHRLERLACPYLLFSSHFDGPLDDYLDELCEAIATEAREIWVRCIGCSPRATTGELKAYMLHNRVTGPALSVSAFPNATVAQIRASLALRSRIRDFVYESHAWTPEERQRRFLDEF